MTPLKCYTIFLTYADILLTIYYKAFIFGTIHGRLSLKSFRNLGPCPRVGLEVKTRTSFIVFNYTPDIYAFGTIHGMLPLDNFRHRSIPQGGAHGQNLRHFKKNSSF